MSTRGESAAAVGASSRSSSSSSSSSVDKLLKVAAEVRARHASSSHIVAADSPTRSSAVGGNRARRSKSAGSESSANDFQVNVRSSRGDEYHRRGRSRDADGASDGSEGMMEAGRRTHHHHHHRGRTTTTVGTTHSGRQSAVSSAAGRPNGGGGGVSAIVSVEEQSDSFSFAAIEGMGDSRSIVLALRALQDKIRKLEADRDFHRDQCESARRAHENYKADIEEQLHRDRTDFRRREADLQELISRAKHEQQRLRKTLDDASGDAARVTGDVGALLERERAESLARETRLKEELEGYRRQLAEERLEVEKVRQQIDQARAERDVLDATNRRLEHSVKDLLSMNKTLIRRTGGANKQHADPNQSAMSMSKHHHSHHQQLLQPPLRFQSATLASINHSNISVHHGGGGGGGNRGRSASQGTAAADARRQSQQQTRTASSSGAAASRHQPQQRTMSGSRRHHATFRPQSSAAAAAEPLTAVYAELERELSDLNKQYRRTIEEASADGASITAEVLTAKLNGIMVQIDRKAEQMRLLRATRASAATEDARHRVPVSKGFDKATHKTQQMNALRRMTAGPTA